MRPILAIQALALLAAICAAAPVSRAATDCTADVTAKEGIDQVTDEAVIKVFAVEASTREACAKVYVDFVVTERLFNGEEITSTHRGWRKVTSDGTLYKVNYRIARDTTITNWEFKVAKCVVCGTE
jgi:hypothetical protein